VAEEVEEIKANPSDNGGFLEAVEDKELQRIYNESREIIRGTDSVSAMQQRMGVLQTIINIPEIKGYPDLHGYLQFCALANFKDDRQADLFSAALSWVLTNKGDPTPILVKAAAQLGVNSVRARDVIGGVTNLNISSYKNLLPGWKKKQENKSI